MANLAPHFFLSGSGDLFDTRTPDWSRNEPVRAAYSATFSEIENPAQLKATLRAGPHSWPGAYPLHFEMSDGQPAAFDSIRKNFRRVLDAFRNGERDWITVSCAVHWEGDALECCISGDPIEPAYCPSEE